MHRPIFLSLPAVRLALVAPVAAGLALAAAVVPAPAAHAAADATISVTGYNVVYDGTAHTATGTATGVNGEDLSGDLNLTGTIHTNAGSYVDTWTFTDPAGTYNNASGTVTDTIVPAATSMFVSSSANPSVFGQAVTFTAFVIASSGATPTGSVNFSVDGTPGTSVPLNQGVATFTTSSLGAGDHNIFAIYPGDSNLGASTSSLAQAVNPAATTTAVSSSANPSTAGQAVTFKATVSPIPPGGGTPTGSVTFTVDNTTSPAAPLNNQGVATFTTSALATGSHQVTVSYGGDANYVGSSGGPLTQTVVTPDNDLAISTPAPITVDATGPSGAVVGTPLQVTDPDDAQPPPLLCPAVPVIYPIGTTTVQCGATDPDDTPSTVSGSFTVTVLGAADQLTALGQAVQGVGPGTSLAGKITTAQSDLASGNTAGACSTLTLFINQVKAQSGKTIPAGQAAQLIADATRIRAVLAC
jgi:large repetitive protein